MNTQTVDITRAHCLPFTTSDKNQSSIDQAQPQPEALLRFTVAMNKFCETIRGLEDVKKIGLKARGESISAWTFVDNPNQETLNKIYSAELELMNSIPNILFDFAVKFDDSPEPTDSYIIMV